MALDAVKMNRFTLAFDDAGLEREFLDDYADSVRKDLRIFWALLLVALAAVTPLDAPDRASYVRLARWSLGGPAAVLVVGTTFLRAAVYRRVWPVASCVAASAVLAMPLASGMALLRWLPSYRPTEDPLAMVSGLVSMVLAFVGLHTVGRARFAQSTTTTAVWSLFYVALTLGGDFGAHATIFVGVFFGLANLLGMAASFRIEDSRRRLFIEQRQLAEEHEKLAAERARSEALLLNVLPAEIAERLKSDLSPIADGFSEVTILFADIVGFTDLSASLSPAEVVSMLNRLFTAFDDLAEKHGLEKIKTIGDAYMVVGGLPQARPDHAEAAVAMALGMRDAVAAVAKETGYALKARIGANTGPVVAGVIGKKKFAYDLWGDAVNTASRMESHGLAGEIQVTEATWAKVKDAFEGESRGTITVKGRGEMQAWLVRGRKEAEAGASA